MKSNLYSGVHFDIEKINKLFESAAANINPNEDLVQLLGNIILNAYKYLFPDILVHFRRSDFKFTKQIIRYKFKYDDKAKSANICIKVRGLYINDCNQPQITNINLVDKIVYEDIQTLISDPDLYINHAKEKTLEFLEKTIRYYDSYHYLLLG